MNNNYSGGGGSYWNPDQVLFGDYCENNSNSYGYIKISYNGLVLNNTTNPIKLDILTLDETYYISYLLTYILYNYIIMYIYLTNMNLLILYIYLI